MLRFKFFRWWNTSHGLAPRLKEAILSIINPNQIGFSKNGFIGGNIRLILDCMTTVMILMRLGFVLFVDFAKAFDSLE